MTVYHVVRHGQKILQKVEYSVHVCGSHIFGVIEDGKQLTFHHGTQSYVPVLVVIWLRGCAIVAG